MAKPPYSAPAATATAIAIAIAASIAGLATPLQWLIHPWVQSRAPCSVFSARFAVFSGLARTRALRGNPLLQRLSQQTATLRSVSIPRHAVQC